MSSVDALAGWTTPGKVTYLNTWSTGFAFALSVGNNCPANNGGGQYYVSWANNPAAKQIYAVVLTAFQAGNLVAANYTCTGTFVSGAADVSGVDVR